MNRYNPKQLPSSRRFSTISGFTLQEMLVSLCISGTLAGGGAGVWNVVQQSAVTAAANDLVSQLALARSEAVTRNVHVSLCPTDDQKTCRHPGGDYATWQTGWLVYTDRSGDGKPQPDEIVRLQTGAPSGIVIRTSRSRSRVTYQALGTAGGSTITFAVCSERDPNLARYVIVSNTGRARVAQTTTSDIKCG